MKEKTRKILKTAVFAVCWLVGIIIPIAAGIAAKENAANGFEVFVGWATMAETVLVTAWVIWLKSKGKIMGGDGDAGESE